MDKTHTTEEYEISPIDLVSALGLPEPSEGFTHTYRVNGSFSLACTAISNGTEMRPHGTVVVTVRRPWSKAAEAVEAEKLMHRQQAQDAFRAYADQWRNANRSVDDMNAGDASTNG
jgi:hypothetical protein